MNYTQVCISSEDFQIIPNVLHHIDLFSGDFRVRLQDVDVIPKLLATILQSVATIIEIATHAGQLVLHIGGHCPRVLEGLVRLLQDTLRLSGAWKLTQATTANWVLSRKRPMNTSSDR